MERICPKCGVLSKGASGSDLEACPACGVIYAKVALARAQQRLGVQQIPTRGEPLPMGRLVGGVVAVLLAVGVILAYQKHAATAQAEAQKVLQHAQQLARERAMQQIRLDQRKRQKAVMLHAMEEFATLDQERSDWEMQLRIAASTSRIALAGPVKDLAETAKHTRALQFDTPCVSQSRDLLVTAMDIRVDDFLLFMQQREYDSTPGKAESAMSAFESAGVKCMRSMHGENKPQGEIPLSQSS